MDKHIELSYCCFESFKVLANNYLVVASHDHFPEIRHLLGETNMTPADVAENLMPKSSKEDAGTCLERLIEALETAKVEAKLKAEEEEEKEKANKDKKKRKKMVLRKMVSLRVRVLRKMVMLVKVNHGNI
ncbi:hypothetical protein RND71_012657 [Anisodus tanguticus]|uniref:AAA+ ATPase At3g28540-like C-terminal domain-containing protein n=1 Tax=Anisodus tanguticus TaxID=243964 RepID=A0AAE1SF25_9SOLA|nr:hypothetical protein RND71_012657 [Anisodus tanguticus]